VRTQTTHLDDLGDGATADLVFRRKFGHYN
jgi:hypothetical protein